MKVIEPTPSQAIVVWKKYLQSLGFAVTASQVQEGLARSKGYPNWQAYVTENDPRGRKHKQRNPGTAVTHAPEGGRQCRKCGSPLDANGWCTDETCAYNSWSQQVEYSDMCNMSREQLQSKYGVQKRQPEGDPELLEKQRWLLDDWLQEVSERIANRPQDETREAALSAVEASLLEAVQAGPLLDGYRHMGGRGELAFEGEQPFLQMSFDRVLSPRFTIELVLTLRDGKFAVYVRTWEFPDNVQNGNYRIFDDLDETVDGDGDETLQRLIERGTREARDQFAALSTNVNLTWA